MKRPQELLHLADGAGLVAHDDAAAWPHDPVHLHDHGQNRAPEEGITLVLGYGHNGDSEGWNEDRATDLSFIFEKR